MTALPDPATRRGRCLNRNGPCERTEREEAARSFSPGQAPACDFEQRSQLALRREGRGGRAVGRTEAGSRRRGDERLWTESELALDDLAELAECRAARHIDPL